MPGGGSNSGPRAEWSGALPSESSLSGYKTIFLNEIGMHCRVKENNILK